MRPEFARGLFVYVGDRWIPGDTSAWAILPGLALIESWVRDEPAWYREKVRTHERVHWRQQGLYAGVGLLLAALTSLVSGLPLGWATVASAAVGAAVGWAAWYVRYGVSPGFRLGEEVEAEAAEKAYLVRVGEWRPTSDAIDAYVESHLDTYYGRAPLLGAPPSYLDVRTAFVRALEDEGVRVNAEAIR